VLLAGKVACSGIAFLLLAVGISGPRSTPLPSGANAGKEVPGIAHPDDVIRMQQTLHDKGHYRGKIDGVFGLRTQASIRAYQKAENLPVTGQLDSQTATKLGITAEVHDENGYETTQVKPSAGVKRADGSGRKSKLPRKTVTRNGTGTVPPA
jgi:peptidoglycan hydrolase-like protein with peptidoglycan-binding domain